MTGDARQRYARFLAWLGPPSLGDTKQRPSRSDIYVMLAILAVLAVEALSTQGLPFFGLRMAASLVMTVSVYWASARSFAVMLIAISIASLFIGVGAVNDGPGPEATLAIALGQYWALYNLFRWVSEKRFQLALYSCALWAS